MNKHYDALVRLQASGATCKDDAQMQRQQLQACAGYCRSNMIRRVFIGPWRLKKELLQCYIDCTRTDLTLNNYVVRSKLRSKFPSGN